jgi:undecaprenol kinase
MINWSKFFRSVPFAWAGIRTLFREENNARIHALAVVCVLGVGWYLQFDWISWILILLCMGGVLALEAVNSAIEAVVDLVSPEPHPLAKKAKDLAAGAVLIFVLFSMVIGTIVVLKHW